MNGFLLPYIKSIITVGICAYICEWICSIGENNGIKKALAFTSGLCIFITVALPFLDTVKSFSEGFGTVTIQNESETSENNSFLLLTEKETADKISQHLIRNLGIDSCNVKLNLELNDGYPEIKSMTVMIQDKYRHLSEQAEKAVKEIFKDSQIVFTGDSNEQSH